MQAERIPERAYCARRIAAGLYIQPSNDGKRRYVIAQREDGTDYGLESGPARFTFWAFAELSEAKAEEISRIARYDRTAAQQALVDVTDVWGPKTKAEAVAEALAHDEATYA